MKVITAEYLISAAGSSQFPKSFLPEVAFAGKSNVGKSSLINAILGRKGLAKTSGTPGKTQQINFFMINGEFRLVDLPGYGYAKVSLAQKKTWASLVENYLKSRKDLKGVILIVDSRHGPSPLDLEMKNWLDTYEVPYLVVANKIDKLKKNERNKNLKRLGEAFLAGKTPLGCSALKGEGQKNIWSTINQWRAK